MCDNNLIKYCQHINNIWFHHNQSHFQDAKSNLAATKTWILTRSATSDKATNLVLI